MMGVKAIDQSDGKFLQDLYEVGLTKPLGYLPISTIVDICGVNIDLLIEDLESREGVRTFLINEELSSVYSGALFAFHEDAMRIQIGRGEKILQRYNWPAAPYGVVYQIATEEVNFDERPDLFKFIAECFADHNNPRLRENSI